MRKTVYKPKKHIQPVFEEVSDNDSFSKRFQDAEQANQDGVAFHRLKTVFYAKKFEQGNGELEYDNEDYGQEEQKNP